jgi:hypothetical protein
LSCNRQEKGQILIIGRIKKPPARRPKKRPELIIPAAKKARLVEKPVFAGIFLTFFLNALKQNPQIALFTTTNNNK